MKTFKDILKEEEIPTDDDGTVDLPTIGELNDDVYDDEELIDLMFDLVTDIDPDVLTPEQADTLVKILDIIHAYDDDSEDDDWGIDETDEVSEALVAKRKKINRTVRLQRRKLYRQKKAKIKLKAKIYRRSAKGKRTMRKSKRMSVLGKTSTGKRKSKFIK